MGLIAKNLLPRDLVLRGNIPRQQLLYARVPDEGVNTTPTAEFSSAAGADSLSFDFTDESIDPDGTVVAWAWDFGDGNTSNLQNPSHSYALAGVYTVGLIVTDNQSAASSETTHDVTATIVMPSFRAVGADATGTGAVTANPHASHEANDVELLEVETVATDPAVTLSTAAGFVEATDSPQATATSTRIQSFWRRWNGTDGSPVIADPGNHITAAILSFKDCVLSGVPFDDTAGDNTAGSTTVTCPGVTTTQANCLVVAACALGTDTLVDQSSNPVNADLSNVAIIADVWSDQGGGGGFGVVAGGKAVAGAVGNTTWTVATTGTQAHWVGALKGRGAS